MVEYRSADATLLEALRRQPLVFVRTPDDRSVVVERSGRRVLVACTDRATLGAWWREHAADDSAAPFVRELPFQELVGLWAAPEVDLLVDPGPDGGIMVPIEAARRQLGLGPTVIAGDGSEPLPFTGLVGGKGALRLPLTVALVLVTGLVLGLVQGNLLLVVGALVGLALGVLVPHRSTRQIRAGWQANRRLSESQRRRARGSR